MMWCVISPYYTRTIIILTQKNKKLVSYNKKHDTSVLENIFCEHSKLNMRLYVKDDQKRRSKTSWNDKEDCPSFSNHKTL
jgi:hypothetical protein